MAGHISTAPVARAPARKLPRHAEGLAALWPHGKLKGHRKQFRVQGLGTAPVSLRSGDAARARDMLMGQFTFAGSVIVGVPSRLFEEQAPEAWRHELNSLAWLRHMVADGRQFSRLIARSLILEWAKQPPRALPVTARINALIMLCEASSFLCGEEPSDFAGRLADLVGSHAAALTHARLKHPDEKLRTAVALLYATAAFRMPQAASDIATARFAVAIEAVVLPDGGHVSRNASALADLLADLLPLRDALAAGRQSIPQILVASIERMRLMLRMLADESMRLANFQGAAATDKSWISALLGDKAQRGAPLGLAPYAGFARLEKQRSLLLMDAGASAQCVGPLAMEFTDGLEPVIVNCGMASKAAGEWTRALASCAAHSSVAIEKFSDEAQHHVSARLLESPEGALVNAVNAMKLRYEALTHRRSVFLSANGEDLRGEDVLEGSPGKFSQRNVVLRFHLHPSVKAIRGSSGATVSLILESGGIWTFRHRGGLMALEDSVYAGGGQPKASTQIVIRAAQEKGLAIKWSLRRSPQAEPVPYMKRKA
jgi:uncharacterized heparinase superfamily protein